VTLFCQVDNMLLIYYPSIIKFANIGLLLIIGAERRVTNGKIDIGPARMASHTREHQMCFIFFKPLAIVELENKTTRGWYATGTLCTNPDA